MSIELHLIGAGAPAAQMATWMSTADPAAVLKRVGMIAGGLALIAVIWFYQADGSVLATGAAQNGSVVVSVDDHDHTADHGHTCPPNQQRGEKNCHSMASCPVCAATEDVVASLDYASHYVVLRRDQIHPSRVIEPQPQPPQNS